MEAAPAPGVVGAIRPTALPVEWIRPRLHANGDGLAPDHPAVRRFWTALVGPGAVADLLRLTAAATSGRPLRRPVHLEVLLSEGLVRRRADAVVVTPRIPYLTPGQVRRLRPALRAEYLARIAP
jgi:hypothetical protein